MKMNKNDEVDETRFCKKCGCELVSTNKRKLCENCRRNRNKQIGRALAGIGTTAVSIILFLPQILGALNNNADDDSDKENDYYSATESDADDDDSQ